jgi:hypothetical protein
MAGSSLGCIQDAIDVERDLDVNDTFLSKGRSRLKVETVEICDWTIVRPRTGKLSEGEIVSILVSVRSQNQI